MNGYTIGMKIMRYNQAIVLYNRRLSVNMIMSFDQVLFMPPDRNGSKPQVLNDLIKEEYSWTE